MKQINTIVTIVIAEKWLDCNVWGYYYEGFENKDEEFDLNNLYVIDGDIDISDCLNLQHVRDNIIDQLKVEE